MRKKRIFTSEFKLEQVLKYTNNHQSYSSISKEIGIDKSVVRRWVGLYKSKGTLGLEINKTKFLLSLLPKFILAVGCRTVTYSVQNIFR
jgi:transposase-like protein